VLVIEDDAEIRDALVEYLEEEGYEVACAENGADGLTRLGDGPLPSVVLLDSAMPVLDGAATLARLRANPAWAAIPVVLSSADARVAELGADRYLTKPFTVGDLVATLKELLARRR
jgi:CheY-like chemotaxis protein